MDSIFERTVEVLLDRGTGRPDQWSAGTGCLVGNRRVLTAAHVIDYGGAGRVTIRTLAGAEYIAEVTLTSEQSSGIDLALLKVVDPVFNLAPGPVPLAAVNRDEIHPVTGCWTIGFPRFQEGPSTRLVPSTKRQTAQAWGYILPGTNLRDFWRLELRTTLEPAQLRGPKSGWAGMSGAPVYCDRDGEQFLLGVVVEHHLSAGLGAVTLVPIAAAAGITGWTTLLDPPPRVIRGDAGRAHDRRLELARDVLAESAARAAGMLAARRTPDGEGGGPEAADDLLTRANRMQAVPTPAVPGDEHLVALLGSPQLATLVDQLLGRHVLGHYHPSAAATLRAAFYQLCDLYNVVDPTLRAGLFDELESACVAVFQDVTFMDRDISSYWESSLIYSVDAIRDQVDALNTYLARGPSVESVPDFKERLRALVRAANSTISLTMLGRLRNLPVSEIYVEPTLTGDRDESTALSEITARRAVILGGPGLGKSTLAVKLAFDGNAPAVVRRPQTFVVTLRDLASRREAQPISLLEYLVAVLRDGLQLADASSEIVTYLLIGGDLQIIFDGLDEVIEPTTYDWIVAAIDSFCLEYKATGVTITSRPYGFDQKRFAGFAIYHLSPFDDRQVTLYAQRWFGLDESIEPARRIESAAEFLRQSKPAADLRATPLLLALMCSVFSVEGDIPASRSELYQRCAQLYFRDWDTRRRIRSSPLVASVPQQLLFGAFSHLAAAILSNEVQSGSGITVAEIRSLLSRFFEERQFLDPAERQGVIEEITGFLVGRAWLFDKVGRNANGAVLYQFAHRTFLEYFAAEHHLRRTTGPAGLAELTLTSFGSNGQPVVAELAFQLSARSRPAQTEAAILIMIDAAEHSTLKCQEETAKFLVSLLRGNVFDLDTVVAVASFSLRFAVRVIEVGRTAFSACGYGDTDDSSWFVYRSLWSALGSDLDIEAPSAVLTALVYSDALLNSTARDRIRQVVVELASGHPWAGGLLICALCSVQFSPYGYPGRSRDNDQFQWWNSLQKAAWHEVRDQLSIAAWQDPSLAAEAALMHNVSVRFVIDAHGLLSLFRPPLNPAVEDTEGWTLCGVLLRPAIAIDGGELSKGAAEGLRDVFHYAQHRRPPWPMAQWDTMEPIDRRWAGSPSAVRGKDWDPEVEAGAILLLMLSHVLSDSTQPGRRGSLLDLHFGPHLEPYRTFLSGWRTGSDGRVALLEQLEGLLPTRCALVIVDAAMFLRNIDSHAIAMAHRPPIRRNLDNEMYGVWSNAADDSYHTAVQRTELFRRLAVAAPRLYAESLRAAEQGLSRWSGLY